MGTTKSEIRAWLNRGKTEGATHTLVVCDTYDHTDYPVHVMPGQDARKVYEAHQGPNMQRVMEVYSHALDHESQLNEHRSHHFE
jgi:hypothetical protein